MLEGEGLELPVFVGAVGHESEDSSCGAVLDAFSTSGADPEFAGLAAEEEALRLEVADDERVAAASSESVEAVHVRFDVREEVKPKLSFWLAVVKADDLLRRVAVLCEGLRPLRGHAGLLEGDCPAWVFYG